MKAILTVILAALLLCISNDRMFARHWHYRHCKTYHCRPVVRHYYYSDRHYAYYPRHYRYYPRHHYSRHYRPSVHVYRHVPVPPRPPMPRHLPHPPVPPHPPLPPRPPLPPHP
ncbi:MAG: hypothetical protein J0H46_18870 [Bacteroidetes bacterium]|nr:hypothetical protein [Bacteroidota bacterium]